MKTQRSLIGFVVIEAYEDFEMVLGLKEGANLPPGGILEWTDDRRAIFPGRKEARAAIDRTEHYRLAFGQPDRWPSRKFCKIVPVEMIGGAS